MCCFKRLATKIKRKAGWARKERAPAVTRPSDTQIKQKKTSAKQGKKRNERRRVVRENKEESVRRDDFYQQKGWAT